MNDSYTEKCIRALPEEKQSAARAAFKDIAEGGGDSIFSKVLVTLEATSAFAASIPHDLTACGERLLREFEARASRLAQEQTNREAQRDEDICRIISEQVPRLEKSLGFDQVIAVLRAQTTELGRLDRNMCRLRRARFSGLVFLILLGAFCGASVLGKIYWKRYEQAQEAYRLISRLDASGIVIEARRVNQREWLTVSGPALTNGSAWKNNNNGEAIGANLVFPIGGDQ